MGRKICIIWYFKCNLQHSNVDKPNEYNREKNEKNVLHFFFFLLFVISGEQGNDDLDLCGGSQNQNQQSQAVRWRGTWQGINLPCQRKKILILTPASWSDTWDSWSSGADVPSCPEPSAITIEDWGIWELHNLSDVGFSWKQLSISTLPLPLRERERLPGKGAKKWGLSRCKSLVNTKALLLFHSTAGGLFIS